MGYKRPNLICFSSLALSEPIISGATAKSDVVLTNVDGTTIRFSLIIKYTTKLHRDHLPLLKIAFCMPLLNYGLFSKKLMLNFPIDESDLSLLNKMNVVFSRDIFVNKI